VKTLRKYWDFASTIILILAAIVTAIQGSAGFACLYGFFGGWGLARLLEHLALDAEFDALSEGPMPTVSLTTGLGGVSRIPPKPSDPPGQGPAPTLPNDPPAPQVKS